MGNRISIGDIKRSGYGERRRKILSGCSDGCAHIVQRDVGNIGCAQVAVSTASTAFLFILPLTFHILLIPKIAVFLLLLH